jgi:hypothetical protein
LDRSGGLVAEILDGFQQFRPKPNGFKTQWDGY